jgi:hypothetical protein
MNQLDWFAQMLLAGVFLFAGLRRFLLFQRKAEAVTAAPIWRSAEFPPSFSWAIALLEIGGALALVLPLTLWRPDFLPQLAAMGLALLTLCVCVYRVRRREPATPVMVLFLMTLFVIVGRLPW